MSKHRFSQEYGGCLLFVEQTAPNVWQGSVYEERFEEVPLRNESGVVYLQRRQVTQWERFICLDEKCAKRCALTTVENRLRLYKREVPKPGVWLDRSGEADDEWTGELERRTFPGKLT